MAPRYPLPHGRHRELVRSGLLEALVQLPRLPVPERTRARCSVAARGLQPELVRFAAEAAESDARAAEALAEEDPAAAMAYAEDAEFWRSLVRRHPDPRRRWGAATRAATKPAKAKPAKPEKAKAKPQESRPARPAPDHGVVAPPAHPVPAGRTVADLPPWAIDVMQGLPTLVSRAEAARTLGCSTRSLVRRIDEGALAEVPVGGRRMIARLELVRWLVAEAARAR